jgi:quinolinate synthase
VDEVAELKDRISELKKALGAVVVAHNYQRPEVQDVADFVGDSLELARKCIQVDCRVIVFCGVRFMAESAAILNPDKTVLLSEEDASCPLADMLGVDDLKEWKRRYPQATVACYINSSAEVKAESDICCTSANALEVVESLPGEEVLFVPDRNLGHYVSTRSKKRIILYPGFCYVHQRLKAGQVRLARRAHPKARLLVHPECGAEVIALSDAALSTSQMLRHVRGNESREFIIGTEEGLLHHLRLENPEKSFYTIITKGQICRDMKKTTLESVARVMELRQNVVTVPPEVRERAKRTLDRMLAVV